ncbi:MAG: hypothetical protein COW47_02470 [Candidatus Huberarchaeum crystalense]|uniref:Uncharacterized protein n=2 Tax=Huberarchaeum crystalense TaxID=2014257 RepID=A0A2H9MMA3_HUBC1|nr:MAG: hypothetical protein COS45_02660 [Candidatus Huberarchaeum crystalense]PIV89522.1 MAG: hypothetical protein COW47_02470 [Candidatus Huberarchaeum crystalense]PIX27972.1 MAG: hypothetical protein COZ66_02065 [Candidatus Huberarchaeum crystalense]
MGDYNTPHKTKEEIGDGGLFMEKANNILKKTRYLGCAANTLLLILPSEKKFYNALIEKINKGEIYLEYLFSLQSTKEAIIEYVRKNGKNGWEEIKKNWGDLVYRCPNVSLRYIDRDDFISCIISDHHTLVMWKGDKENIGVTYITRGMSFYKNLFDEIFATGSNAHLEAIQSIEEKLNEMGLIKHATL